jgi:hypothetical protein
MIHLNIHNTSYGRKKGWESKCQFDSRPLKSRIALNYMRANGMPHAVEKLLTKAKNVFIPHFNWRYTQEIMGFQNGERLNFKTFDLGISRKMTFGCSLCG